MIAVGAQPNPEARRQLVSELCCSWTYGDDQLSEPPREELAPLHTKIIDDSGGVLMVQGVMYDTGGSWSMLTWMNCIDWTLLMQVMLVARQLWVIDNDGTPEREMGHITMECVLRSVPPAISRRCGW